MRGHHIAGPGPGSQFLLRSVNYHRFYNQYFRRNGSSGKATLSFPSDLVLSAGFASVRSIEGTAGSGILATTQTAQIDWQLTGYGRRLEERPINLSLDVNGSHYTSLRDIQVKTIAGLLYGQATTEAGAPVAGAAIAVLNGAGAVVAAAVTQADGTYAVSGLAPGSYRVRMSAAGRFSGGVMERCTSS